jgi:hypothetical protein
MIAALYVLAGAFGLVLRAVIYLAVRIWLLERQASLLHRRVEHLEEQ